MVIDQIDIAVCTKRPDRLLKIVLALIYHTDFNFLYFGVDELAQVVHFSTKLCRENQVAFGLCISLNVTFNPVRTLLVLIKILLVLTINHVFDLSYMICLL